MGQLQHFSLVLKPAYGKLRTQLYALNVIQSEHYDDEGLLHIDIRIAPHKQAVNSPSQTPIDEILGERASQFKRSLEEFEIKH